MTHTALCLCQQLLSGASGTRELERSGGSTSVTVSTAMNVKYVQKKYVGGNEYN